MSRILMLPRCLRWITVAAAAAILSWPVSAASGAGAPAGPAVAPLYVRPALSNTLQKELEHKSFKLEPKSGNFLSPRVFSKTRKEELVALLINDKYVKDMRGQTVFLRQSIREKLEMADAAMFRNKKEHISVTYGFRSNELQEELFRKLSGKSKVAPAGESFHETGMALDIANWRDAQRYMIEAGFVGGCYGIEEDLVHYSIDEISKASKPEAFKRCTLKEIPEDIIKGLKKVGSVTKVGNLIKRGKN